MGSEKTFVENPIKKFLQIRRLNGDRVFIWKVHQTSANIKGISDINAIINGHFVAIEVKAKGEHASDEQKVFGGNVIKAGGTFVICDDYQSFVSWYERFITKSDKGGFYNLTGNLRNELCRLC